jgi:carbon starvation protein
VGVLSCALALGNWKAIWPVFGASNQLIASLVLIVASVYLLSRNRRFLFTAVPAVVMLVTTIGALVYKTYSFITAEKANIMLATISVILIILAIFLSVTGLVSAIRARTAIAVKRSGEKKRDGVAV